MREICCPLSPELVGGSEFLRGGEGREVIAFDIKWSGDQRRVVQSVQPRQGEGVSNIKVIYFHVAVR